MSNKHPCMSCGSSDALVEYADGTHCFSCKKSTKRLNLSHIPIKESKDIGDIPIKQLPEAVKKWLYQYYISDELIKNNSLTWSPGHARLVIPIVDDYSFPTAGWLRSIDPAIKPKWLYVGDKPAQLLYLHRSNIAAFPGICVVEDALSAIRVSEYMDVVSLGGTNFSSEHLSKILLSYSEIVLWLDGDRPGRVAADKFIKKFKLFRPIYRILTKQDPKSFTPRHMEELLYDK